MKKWTKKPLLPLLALLLLIALPGASSGQDAGVKENPHSDLDISNTAKLELSQQVNWLSYAEAMSEGRSRDQKIILFFTIGGDQWCSKMENETFANARVIAYLNNNFVISKIDRNRFPSLAKRYKVDAMPTLWFLDSKGKGLTSTDGFMPPKQMLLLLEFISSELYKETTFQNWKEGGRSRR